MPRLLGIDLGTSGLKAAVFDLDGNLLGLGRAPSQYLSGPPGWAEQDPRAWWTGCCQAVQEALAQAGGPATAGLAYVDVPGLLDFAVAMFVPGAGRGFGGLEPYIGAADSITAVQGRDGESPTVRIVLTTNPAALQPAASPAGTGD